MLVLVSVVFYVLLPLPQLDIPVTTVRHIPDHTDFMLIRWSMYRLELVEVLYLTGSSQTRFHKEIMPGRWSMYRVELVHSLFERLAVVEVVVVEVVVVEVVVVVVVVGLVIRTSSSCLLVEHLYLGLALSLIYFDFVRFALNVIVGPFVIVAHVLR